MHDTDSRASPEQISLREEAILRASHAEQKPALAMPAGTNAAKPQRLFARMLAFFARLFKRRNTVKAATERTASDRAAAALAAHMAPPTAFKGDTANTLITPMGTYAGKPVEQATRKRAEQQFKNMDVTRTTMN